MHSSTINLSSDLNSILSTLETACNQIKKLLEPLTHSCSSDPDSKTKLKALMSKFDSTAQIFFSKTIHNVTLKFSSKNDFLFPFHHKKMPSFIHEICYTDHEKLFSDQKQTVISKIKILQEERSKFITMILKNSENDLENILNWPEYHNLKEAHCQFLTAPRLSKGPRTDFFYCIQITPSLRRLFLTSKAPIFVSLFKETQEIFFTKLEESLKNHLKSLFEKLIELEKFIYQKITTTFDELGISSHIDLLNDNQFEFIIPLDKNIIYEFYNDLFTKNPYLLLFSAGILDTFKSEENFNNYCLSHDIMITELTKKTMGHLPFHYIH